MAIVSKAMKLSLKCCNSPLNRLLVRHDLADQHWVLESCLMGSLIVVQFAGTSAGLVMASKPSWPMIWTQEKNTTMYVPHSRNSNSPFGYARNTP